MAAKPSKFLSQFMTQAGPLYRQIEAKIQQQLAPTFLDIQDDSAKHRHHQAMVGNTLPETHFRVTIVSEEFKGKPLIKRHRMINELLKEEFTQGLHALQLVTKTPEEYNKQ
jgi:BolA protein